jgi:VanZ family protein
MKLILFRKPLIWLVLICIGLFLPARDLPVKPFLFIPYFDKMVHFGLFFVFALLLYRPYKQLNLKYMLWAPLTALTFGALLESVQRTISATRDTDIHDFMANTAGVIVSILVYHYFISGKKWERFF